MKFGPAGNSAYYTATISKSTADAPRWLKSIGLDAFEYPCGRGVAIKDESAKIIGDNAKAEGILMSVHSPYFISLSNRDKNEGNIRYVLDSGRVARLMNADRIVIHSGSAGSDRRNTIKSSIENLKDILKRTEDEGYGDILFCIETMGKINQLGTVDEVIEQCQLSERLIPCVDFGHLYARTHGEFATAELYADTLDKLSNSLGFERVQSFHMHFSKIEFSAGGEVRHLIFEDNRFGPDFSVLAPVLIEKGFTPRVICESAGTQAFDALEMKKIYESLIKK